MLLHREAILQTLALLAQKCPRLPKSCYWARTSAIAIDELGHRESYDLDFHTRRALRDVRPLMTELRRAFGDSLELLQEPDSFGQGFRALLATPAGDRVPVDVMANFEDIPSRDLTVCRVAPAWKRPTLQRYLRDKLQCVVERAESRDLVDIEAVLSHEPALASLARKTVGEHDAILLVQRLRHWTDEALERDLRAYPGVDWKSAALARNRLLEWIRP